MGTRTYEVVARRDDGVTLRVRTPDKPLKIPHDMAHFVVERELSFDKGFWGSIASGVVFASVQVVSGRQPPHAAEQSAAMIKASYKELAAAELYVAVMQGVERDGKERDHRLVCSRLDEVWRPFRWPRPPVSAEDALNVCRALREAEGVWTALPVGESVTLSWAHAPKRATRRKRAQSRARVLR
jgi:hypothetical protein